MIACRVDFAGHPNSWLVCLTASWMAGWLDGYFGGWMDGWLAGWPFSHSGSNALLCCDDKDFWTKMAMEREQCRVESSRAEPSRSKVQRNVMQCVCVCVCVGRCSAVQFGSERRCEICPSRVWRTRLAWRRVGTEQKLSRAELTCAVVAVCAFWAGRMCAAAVQSSVGRPVSCPRRPPLAGWLATSSSPSSLEPPPAPPSQSH